MSFSFGESQHYMHQCVEKEAQERIDTQKHNKTAALKEIVSFWSYPKGGSQHRQVTVLHSWDLERAPRKTALGVPEYPANIGC